MKKLMLVLLVASQLISLTSAQAAGGQEGHGGGGFLCANPSDNELLDLFEAKIAGLNIVRTPEAVEQQIERAMLRFDEVNPVFSAKVRAVLNGLMKPGNSLRTEPGEILNAPIDGYPQFTKSNCQFVGLAVYFDRWQVFRMKTLKEDTLVINTDLYNSVSPTDQAALWVHEAVYKVLRSSPLFRDWNSTKARIIVGQLFSDKKIISTFDGLPKAGEVLPSNMLFFSPGIYLSYVDDEVLKLQITEFPDGYDVFGNVFSYFRNPKLVEFIKTVKAGEKFSKELNKALRRPFGFGQILAGSGPLIPQFSMNIDVLAYSNGSPKKALKMTLIIAGVKKQYLLLSNKPYDPNQVKILPDPW